MFFSHYFVFGTGHILDFHATEKEPQLKRKNLQRVSISSSLEIPFSKRCGRVRIAVCDQVGASSLRGHHVTVPNTPWSDIGGMEEVGVGGGSWRLGVEGCGLGRGEAGGRTYLMHVLVFGPLTMNLVGDGALLQGGVWDGLGMEGPSVGVGDRWGGGWGVGGWLLGD